jgi:methylenetetrahydrofolate reductase (NADPH)
MKLSEKIKSYNSPTPFYTFEFFPPRTDQVFRSLFLSTSHELNISPQGFENLITRIDRLSTLKPIAISITWGAGGSTKDRSLDLAGLTQTVYGIDTVLHLTCTNMMKGMVDDALRVRSAHGLRVLSDYQFHRLPKTEVSKLYSHCVEVI